MMFSAFEPEPEAKMAIRVDIGCFANLVIPVEYELFNKKKLGGYFSYFAAFTNF